MTILTMLALTLTVIAVHCRRRTARTRSRAAVWRPPCPDGEFLRIYLRNGEILRLRAKR